MIAWFWPPYLAADRTGIPQPASPLEGDYLVLRYPQVLSLSVRYVEFDLPSRSEAGAGEGRPAEPRRRLDLLAA